MNYKAYGKDQAGQKVESRKARKIDRRQIFVHNKSQHSKRLKKEAANAQNQKENN